MKNWIIALLALSFLSSCGVDKSADKMAENTTALNRIAEKMEKHAGTMADNTTVLNTYAKELTSAFVLLLQEFKALNGNLEVLKEMSPLIKKFDEFLEEGDGEKISEEEFFDFGDIDIPIEKINALERLKQLEAQISSLNLNNPKEKQAYDKINFTLEATAQSVEATLEQLKK